MNKNIICCKLCGTETRRYDRVRRIIRCGYGKKKIAMIDRYICLKCGKVCRALPDNLLPYKQYDRRIIEGFVNGKLSSELLEFEDYPCETTIANWKRYF